MMNRLDSHPASRQSRRPRRERDPDGPIDLAIRPFDYTQIEMGRKTIEGVADYRWVARAVVGGLIDFIRRDDDPRLVRCTIEWIERAPDFEEALLNVRWQDAAPTARTFDEALHAFNRRYRPGKIEEIGGVVLFGLSNPGIAYAGQPQNSLAQPRPDQLPTIV